MSNAIYTYWIDGMQISVLDGVGSNSTRWIANELLADDYRVREMQFEAQDVIVDVGAHVGLFSIYLAMKWPEVRVLAFEPFPPNFLNCAANLKLNGITNVTLLPLAISADGRALDMAVTPDNTGGASAVVSSFLNNLLAGQIESITLDTVFQTNHISRCRLLKMDCEGMEHEILLSTGVLDRIDRLSAEFHDSPSLLRRGWSSDHLLKHCLKYFDQSELAISMQLIPA